jgi:UDP-N-acetylmuramoyl-tripeptide--D-alanyl-D-alanine ligase
LVAPQVAIVLNVLPAHIGNLGSLDAIRTEKLSIRAGLPDNGTLICPLELGVPGSFTFSTNREADIWADPNAAGGKDSDDHLAAVHLNGQRYELRMSAGGEHRLQTALAVLAGVYCLGGEVEAAVDTLASLSVPPGRGNRLSIAGRTIIDDSYNANPVSMNYAISALLSEPGRRVLLMGEMLELGDESGDLHRAAAIRSAPVDVVYSFGDHFQRLEGVFGPGYAGHVDSATGFDIDGFAASTLPGDVIVVKGSNRVFWAHGFVDKLCAALKRASRPSLSSPSKP